MSIPFSVLLVATPGRHFEPGIGFHQGKGRRLIGNDINLREDQFQPDDGIICQQADQQRIVRVGLVFILRAEAIENRGRIDFRIEKDRGVPSYISPVLRRLALNGECGHRVKRALKHHVDIFVVLVGFESLDIRAVEADHDRLQIPPNLDGVHAAIVKEVPTEELP